MRKVLAIIQARMGSTRLPGKVLLPLAGREVLHHVIDRVSAAKTIGRIVVATSTLPADDVIAKLCAGRSTRCFRGDEKDVLARYFAAASNCGGEIIVRITSDCPVIDPEVIDAVVQAYDPAVCDYLSNAHPVRTYPVGLDTEVFSYDALSRAHERATLSYDREHVTPHFYRNPNQFRIGKFVRKDDLSHHRWTLDTQEDYEKLSKIFDALYVPGELFHFGEILAFEESSSGVGDP